MPKYYVKKRAAEGSFHMIASRHPLVNQSDPYLLADPAFISPNRPNEFETQMGWIFCSYSVLEPPVLYEPITLRSENCGIEETLVEICMQDADVIDRVELNYRSIFTERHPIASVARSAGRMYQLARNNCLQLLQVNFRGYYQDIDRVKAVIRGASMAGFYMVLFIIKDIEYCPANGSPKWEHYELDVLLNNDGLLGRIDQAKMFFNGPYGYTFAWYFCH